MRNRVSRRRRLQFYAAIRHSEIGANPFIPVIATTWDPTPELVRKIIDSGADDLVVKPISVGHLLERVQSLVYKRKPFVVTADYVGPDRHRTPSRMAETALIDVPNPLKARITGEEETVSAQTRIDEVIAEINLHKLERYAADIGSLVNIVLPKLAEGRADSGARDILGRLEGIAARARRRMADTEREHVSELCGSLSQVVKNLLAAEDAVNPKDVKCQ